MKKTVLIILLGAGSILFWHCGKEETNPYKSLECFVYYTKNGKQQPVRDNIVSVSLVPDGHAFLKILTNKEGKINIPVEKGLYYIKASNTIIDTLYFEAPPTDTVNIKKDTTLYFKLEEEIR